VRCVITLAQRVRGAGACSPEVVAALPARAESLRELGFAVLRAELTGLAERVSLAALSAVLWDGVSRAAPIFNNAANDRRRLQGSPDPTAPEVAAAVSVVVGLMQRLAPSHTVTGVKALYSLPGCARQRVHEDYDRGQLELLEPDRRPLAALLAVDPGAEIEVELHASPFTVALRPGDLFVFRGDLRHAGAGYEVRNVRMHFYVDCQEVPRIPDEVYRRAAK